MRRAIERPSEARDRYASSSDGGGKIAYGDSDREGRKAKAAATATW
jgi:hypothetical protein